MNVRRVLTRAAQRIGRLRPREYIDHFDASRVAGWILDPQAPTRPAQLSVIVDGAPEFSIVADLARSDVQAAGLGTLNCGFDVSLPRHLRDGQAHLVELRREPGGRALRGGVLKIAADQRQADAAGPISLTEGVAFFDSRVVAIVGWATGCDAVSIRFDSSSAHTAPLDREVPGLGRGVRRGFSLPIPAEFMDGTWHEADVRYGSGGNTLDGAPVRFRVEMNQPLVEITQQIGWQATFMLRDHLGNKLRRDVIFLADDKPIEAIQDHGAWTVTLPKAACQLVVAAPDHTPLARFLIEGSGLFEPLPSGLSAGASQLSQPSPEKLPSLTFERHASDSIYAAWVARLAISDDIREEIARDETAVRDDIVATSLSSAPLVSIIMPSWNRAFTIGEAIQSVLEQSYDNWELLIADDASEDRTAEVVRKFDDPRIRYMKFLKSNGAGARNKALRFARGEYIAYLDSDNIWHPLFLSMMIRQLQANPALAMAYSAYLDTEIEGATVELRTISRPAFRAIPLSSKNFVDLNTVVHHRRLYDWMGGFDETLPRLQDWDLALRYTSIFRPVFVNRIGVFYRRNVAWGQVTHLFHNSGAQNTVNEKTCKRLNSGPERLNVPWPTRDRITVLHGRSFQARAMAESLARVAADCAEVEIVTPESLSAAGIDQPVLLVGLDDQQLQGLPEFDPASACRLLGAGTGSALQALDDPAVHFDLGALPLDLPRGGHDPSERMVLLLPPKHVPPGLMDRLSAQAKRYGLTLLPWPETGMPISLGRVGVTLCLRSISDMTPFDLALVNALQGRGVPVAIRPEDAGSAEDDLAQQWIDAKAAYEIKVDSPEWIFEKLRKLLNTNDAMARLQERSRKVHRIALAPEQTREKLVNALYWLTNERPRQRTEETSAERGLMPVLLPRPVQDLSIRIKISTPNLKEAPVWGDYHFANSLAGAFERIGHQANVDTADMWYSQASQEDVVITLRGRHRVQVNPAKVNILWVISHPDRIPDEEYNDYDHVFVASDIYAAKLRAQGLNHVSVLHQAVDTTLFQYRPEPERKQVCLFVGNSRKEYRTMVKWCVQRSIPLELYGGGWDGILPGNMIKGASVANADLPDMYCNHLILLNDHWESMRENGFLSNRLFDGSAMAAPIVSDPVAGLADVFGDAIPVAEDADSFGRIIEDCIANPTHYLKRAERARDIVLAAHTFDHRATEIARKVDQIAARKRRKSGRLFR